MTAILDRARSLSPLIEEHAERAERERTLPPPLVDAIHEAGLFRFVLPKELGGEEADFSQAIEVWEELARADGSTGWTVMANGSGAAAAGAYLSEDAIGKIFGDGSGTTVGGQFAPRGTGLPEVGGHRVTGSYSFGSGSGHSAYVSAGFTPLVDGAPIMRDDGLPEMRVGFVPYEDVEFKDGWHVMGLRGTGSYDYEVKDRLIPEGYSFLLFGAERLRGNELFRAGMMPMTAAGHAAFALGVGRRALDEIRDIATTRQRMGDPTPIAGKATFQKGYIRAEAKLRSARLFVLDSFGDAYRSIQQGDDITLEQRALLRCATCFATEAAKEASAFAHETAGTVAIRNGTILQRCFLDMHTGSQHVFIGEKVYMDCGQVLLGTALSVPGL